MEKDGQVVPTYALNAIPSSSPAPAAKEKGKGINILEVMLLVQDIPVRVLFDRGASRSFISNNLIGRLGLQPVLVDRPLVVSNPVGGSASIKMICLGVELSSHDKRFVCDLFVPGFEGYGIILGMD